MNGFVRGKWIFEKVICMYKRVFLQCARKTKTRLNNLIEDEIASLGKVKTQFGLLVKFSIIWDDKSLFFARGVFNTTEAK